MATVSANALTSLESVRQALQLEETETQKDEFLINLINRVSIRIESYCGRQFKARYYTEYQNGKGKPEILLDQYPITYVSGIWSDGTRVFASSSEIDSDDYIIYDDEGRIRLWNEETIFASGPKSVKVCYSGGYDTIPWDLEMAAIDWISTFYRRAVDKVHGYMTKSARGASEMVDLQNIPREVKGILDTYRKPHANDEREE